MSNIYHILYKKPATSKWDMYKELEDIAFDLVRSGRLRIFNEEYANFVRYLKQGVAANMVFSYRELFDPILVKRTTRLIEHSLSGRYSGQTLKQQASKELARLRKEYKKKVHVPQEIEMKVARCMVQATHPAVMLLILMEKAEVFVSFSHSVGDVMDVGTWKEVGENSGLQSTDGKMSAVFVSCGGDPFAGQIVTEENDEDKDTKPEEEELLYGNGYPALARMMVIAGQELGHYADLLRNKEGLKVSRHSARGDLSKAKDNVKIARLRDIDHAKKVNAIIRYYNLEQVMQLEKDFKFFRLHKKWRKRNVSKTKAKSTYKSLIRKVRSKKIKFLHTMPKSETPGLYIDMMLKDMLYNLAPQADVYKNENPDIEEAIACAEALARVPQQVIKWGHKTTSAMMPNLYRIYYGQVIPTDIEYYEKTSGKKIPRKFHKLRKPLLLKIKGLFGREE